MTKDYKVNLSLNSSSIGSIRKEIFDQRKSDYLEKKHDRPVDIIDQLTKHVSYASPSKVEW